MCFSWGAGANDFWKLDNDMPVQKNIVYFGNYKRVHVNECMEVIDNRLSVKITEKLDANPRDDGFVMTAISYYVYSNDLYLVEFAQQKTGQFWLRCNLLEEIQPLQ